MAILEDADAASFDLARRTAELALHDTDAEVPLALPAASHHSVV